MQFSHCFAGGHLFSGLVVRLQYGSCIMLQRCRCFIAAASVSLTDNEGKMAEIGYGYVQENLRIKSMINNN